MTYDEAIAYLYTQMPPYQRVGGAAYKPGLDTARNLDRLFGSPHRRFRSIHVAGTNGKGSVSHTLAAVLQQSGYRVGLYTSPHLVDFRERIRVNGQMISRDAVVDFIGRYRSSDFVGQPSFFELTMTMAFDFFASQNVDFAVIEVGLGGRLDSTNIITPLLSVITNISLDHTQYLGNTLTQIAGEKAGIIKSGVPVVIGEAEGDVRKVFSDTADLRKTQITFAQDKPEVLVAERLDDAIKFQTASYGELLYQLAGDCQTHNANTILHAINLLCQLGVKIPIDAIIDGMAHVCDLTGLMGRWMTVGRAPRMVCDTGHNIGGFEYISKQLIKSRCAVLRIVIGFVGDKDVGHILPLLPRSASYYFTQASIPRAMPVDRLYALATEAGLSGKCYTSVEAAVSTAREESEPDDFIFVGGSTFVVADLLSTLPGYFE